MTVPIWNDTFLERLMFEELNKKLTEPVAAIYITDYKEARQKLVENILEEIKTVEGGLTDHSALHIRNVLDNAYYLIENNHNQLNALELYILCLCILFHDVGNIHGREGHFKVEIIQKIYEFVRNTKNNPRFKEEKLIISNLASVHSGKSVRNTNNPEDTISDLSLPSLFSFHNCSINFKEIAAILRFSDELAEGPQRTSAYMLLNGLIKDETAFKHHRNSYSFNCNINKNDRRIAITYYIAVNHEIPESLTNPKKLEIQDKIKEELQGHLEFAYKRIAKINKERVYCRHYSILLSYFSKISISIFFSINNVEESFNIDPLEFSDLTFQSKRIEEINPDYEIPKMLTKVFEHLNISTSNE